MKYSSNIRADLVAVVASILTIAACSALLYADYARKADAGGAKRIGIITFKKEVAQRKYGSQVIWEDLDRNVPVYDNDSIRTAELSGAVVRLDDGTAITVDENSLILLAMSGEGVNIDFSHGSVAASRATVGGGAASKISITSRDAVVSMNSGGVRLSGTADKELDVTVTEGSAEVRTGNEEKTIGKDEKAIVRKGAGTKVVRLNLRLLSPVHDDIIVTAAPTAPVAFTWADVRGNGGIVLEVAQDSGFTRVTAARAVDGNGMTENLGEGSYYWRIRGRNDAGAEEYSEARKIIILRDTPTGLLYPGNKEVISYSVKPPIINFRWRENKLATGYTVEISRSPAFSGIERSIPTPLLDISVDGLGAGTYFWRVRSNNSGIASYKGVSAVSSFRIERIAALSRPVLIAPSDGRRLSSSMTGKAAAVLFSWSADSQVGQYDFMVSADREFRNIVIREKVKGNFYALREPLDPKPYYWRVGIDASPGGIFSAVNVLQVVPGGTLIPGEPRVIRTGVAGIDEKRADIRFPCAARDFTGARTIELARDRGFLDIAGSVTTTDTFAVMKEIPAGAYYWRVRLHDEDRSQIGEGETQRLFLDTSGRIVGSAEEITPETGVSAVAREGESAPDEGTAATKREQTERARAREEFLEKKRMEETVRITRAEQARTRGEELARKRKAALKKRKKDALAGKQSDDLARKKRKEMAASRGEEIGRKRQEYLAKKRQEEPAVKRREDMTPRQRGELAITSSTLGSAIYVNSKLVGYGTARVNPVPGKKLVITIVADGCDEYRQSLTMGSGEKKKINALLVPGATEFKEKRPGRRLRWRTNLASTIMSRPVHRDNMIVATTRNGLLLGMNLNGGQIWRTALGSVARSNPAADDGAVYIVTVNGFLFSIDLKNGAVKWKKKIEGPLLRGSEPVVDNGRIFLATSYGVVQAFSRDGRELWRRNLEEGIFSSMACDRGVLYVGTVRSNIYAINAGDGGVLWTFDADGAILSSSPRVYRGVLYVGCDSGAFYAINRNGSLRWEFKAKKKILSAPALIGDTVCFGSEDGTIYALETDDGGKLWEFNTRGAIIAGPDVSRDSILVPSGNGIFSIDVKTGELNWREGFPSGVNTPVTVVGNTAFVGLNNGDFISIASF